MDRDRRDREILTIKPCPDGDPDHALVQVDDATADQLDLPRGALLHFDRRKRPGNGDVVLAELVARGRLTRTVRRFTLAEGVVSLARIDGRPGSTIRPRHEVGIVGVVDGRIVPMAPN
jgi:hypothetical protein